MRARVPAHVDVEDIVQEAYCQAYAAIRARGPPEKACSWLLTIARRMAGRDARRRGLGRVIYSNSTDIESSVREPVQIACSNEEAAELSRGLERLLPQTRGLLSSYYEQGLTCRECAEKHQVSYAAVRKRLSRARRQLSRSMGYGDQP